VDEIQRKGDCRNILEADLLRAGWAGQVMVWKGSQNGAATSRLRAWMIFINIRKLQMTPAEAIDLVLAISWPCGSLGLQLCSSSDVRVLRCV